MIELAMNHERCQAGLPGVARRGVSVHWARQGHRCERHRERGSGDHQRRDAARRIERRNATAELVSVERCSAPETRPAQPPPPRSSPAWSDVPGRMLRLADARAARRRQPMVTETSPHPDEPGGGGEFSQGQRSGCEHGSTVASTVVALDAGLTDETNDQDNEAAVLTPTTGNRP